MNTNSILLFASLSIMLTISASCCFLSNVSALKNLNSSNMGHIILISNDNNINKISKTFNASIVQHATALGNKAYSPNPINITKGDTVIWTNDDNEAPHTVTEGNLRVVNTNPPLFDGLIFTGHTYSFTFNKAGIYDYYCTIHPNMVGKINVTSPTP